MPEIPELHAHLADAAVELREIAEWDIPEILIAHQDDPALHQAIGERSAPSGAQLGREVELADRLRREGEQFALTILIPGQKHCRGRVLVHEIDWERLSARLTVWVAPQLRNRGLGSHALALAAHWLFEQVRLRRLELLVGADNEPMLHAASTAGFAAVASPAAGGDGHILMVSEHG